MICVSIAESSAEKILKALEGLEFAEIRMDRANISLGDAKTIFSKRAKLIATCRPCKLGDNERKKLLLAAIDSGAAYVDIELEADEKYRKEIIDAAGKKGCKVIISFHDYEKTPQSEELKKTLAKCFAAGADIAKIACKVNSQQDNARLMDLIRKDGTVLAIGMGPKGAITRISAPLLGSPFTFASLEKGKETAEGQIDFKSMREMLERLENARQSPKPGLFAVAGNPVIHSRSPDMFNAAFAELGTDAAYTRFAASDAKEILSIARELGMHGLNITSPFKEDIAKLVKLDADAEKIGAVNTVVLEKGAFVGYNTDCIGVRDALLQNGVQIKGKNAVVLGAGGAARAAVHALVSEGANVVVLNRTFEKAQEIAKIFGCTAMKMEELEKALSSASILISCISAGGRTVDQKFLKKGLVVLDANYSTCSALAEDAKNAGCKVIHPLEWLLYQAVPAFGLFTGKKPPLEAMRKALYEERREAVNISLIGFMGAGKTSVAEKLAEETGMHVIDTDREIEANAHLSISDIFRLKGEAEFRRLEWAEVRSLTKVSNAIISCGGGIVLESGNVSMLRKISNVFLLWADANTVMERLSGAENRPLLQAKNPEERRKKAMEILARRLPLYARASHVMINTVGKTPEEIANRIIAELGISRVSGARIAGSSEIDGELAAPPSKSMMVRAVAAALLSEGKTSILNPSFCDDGLAALGIAESLGARIKKLKGRVEITGAGNPYSRKAPGKELDCTESGLCIRMFSAIAALQHGESVLTASGSLLERPIAQVEKLNELGAICRTSSGHAPISITGPMHGGKIRIDGSESSQFLTGLLMALPLCNESSELSVAGLKSKPYIEMTISLLRKFGITIENEGFEKFKVKGKQVYKPITYSVEGDWSGAAFLLVAGAIAGKVKVKGLDLESPQADRAIVDALKKAGAKVELGDGFAIAAKSRLNGFEFDASECPDLFPPLVALASSCKGTSRITGVERLRHKESDRASALVSEFSKIGAKIRVNGNVMEIEGAELHSGEADSHNDHRIAMALAISALNCKEGVKILDADCVSKSYPDFFSDLDKIRVKK